MKFFFSILFVILIFTIIRNESNILLPSTLNHNEKDIKPWILTLTINNPTENNFEILKYLNLFVYHYPSNLFIIYDITVPDHPVKMEFIGSYSKTALPTRESFFTLISQSTEDIKFDLSKSYRFKKNKKYQISISDVLYGFLTENFPDYNTQDDLLEKINDLAILFHVNAEITIFTGEYESNANNYERVERRHRVRSCGIHKYQKAVTNAFNGNKRAVEYLNCLRNFKDDKNSLASYTRFFGNGFSKNVDKVEDIFFKIYKNVNDITIKCLPHVDDEYDECYGTFAFVYPRDPHKTVHVCKLFRDAKDSLALDSKPGILTHEVSHFDSVGGTVDKQYGLYPCEKLARFRPRAALKNADNFEFFVELEKERIPCTHSNYYDKKVSVGTPPVGWTCDQKYFNNSDGCDCGCGAWDLDCDVQTEPEDIYGCDKGVVSGCNKTTFECEYLSSFNAPSSWTCNPQYYDAGDGCDCNCGAYDPDCDNPKLMLYGCDFLDYPVCSKTGKCVEDDDDIRSDVFKLKLGLIILSVCFFVFVFISCIGFVILIGYFKTKSKGKEGKEGKMELIEEI